MTATDQMRTMLAELMGSSAIDGTRPSTKYNDRKVCRSYLLGVCPHEILNATVRRSSHFLKLDVGSCPKIHDPALRADYEREQKLIDHFYDLDAFEDLDHFIRETDRRIEQARKKQDESQEVELSEDAKNVADRLLVLNEKLGKTLAEAETLGQAGHVSDSLKMMEDVDKMKVEKAELEANYRSLIPAQALQQQKLRLCLDCGAFLGIHDNDRRLADHFGGKLHMGFVVLRDKYNELKSGYDNRKHARQVLYGIKGNDKGPDRFLRTERASSSRRRSRSRERSSKKRSRSRDRKRSRSRDRKGERKRRSRSRERNELSEIRV